MKKDQRAQRRVRRVARDVLFQWKDIKASRHLDAVLKEFDKAIDELATALKEWTEG